VAAGVCGPPGLRELLAAWQAFGLAAGAAGLACVSPLSLWTGMFADRAVPVWWEYVSVRICETQDSAEPRSLTARM